MSVLIRRITETSRDHAWLVTATAVLLTVCGLYWSSVHLAVDTDTDNLFSTSLPWRQREIAFDRDFPQFNDLIVVVVRGTTPEEAEETAAALTIALSGDHTHFLDSSAPGSLPFFRREGFLLLPLDDLRRMLDSIYSEQALLGPLAADPSARGLFDSLALMAQGVRVAHADLSKYAEGLNSVKQALDNAAAGRPTPLSWESLIGSDSLQHDSGAQFVLVNPVLDKSSLQPGLLATQEMLRVAELLPDVKAGRAQVTYTGSVPLNDVEFGSLTEGMLGSTLVSLILLTLWLYLALRSYRSIIPILFTLIVGLSLTVAFAGLTIGRLNLISVAFAVLFVGLAVDFAIQFTVRLRDIRHSVANLNDAIAITATQVGGQIAVAAAATACGFLAFAPTAFVGVAELGIIAGVGMCIAFVCTIMVLPAALKIFRPGIDGGETALPFGPALDDLVNRYRSAILVAFTAAALAGIVSAIGMPFDTNPLHTKDPNSEPMRTLTALMDEPATNPFRIDVLAANLEQARELGQRLAKLPEVASVISGADFVPQDQAGKLDELAQARDLLVTSIGVAPTVRPPTTADLRTSAEAAMAEIDEAIGAVPPESPLRGMRQSLARLSNLSSDQLLAMNSALTRFLPRALASLNDALHAAPITMADLPEEIRRDWFLADGRVRIQVLPTAAAQTTDGLRGFVKAVQTIAPQAGGAAVTITASAATILLAFKQAAALATLAIALILLAALRRLPDTALVVTTLVMSALLTAFLAQCAGISLNYANIIALPLLLGVGVSFNVYFVMNWRAGMRVFLGSATARAILFSALTTGTAFGSLAASHDRGMASMGLLLLLSLGAVLLATFVFLPALLYALTPDNRVTSG